MNMRVGMKESESCFVLQPLGLLLGEFLAIMINRIIKRGLLFTPLLVNSTISTVTNWEKHRTSPRLYLVPKIIEFLGYDPLQSNATTLGEKIKQYRIQRGLSLRKLAKELGVDPGTLARREVGESELCGKLKKRINSFLNILAG